MSKLLRNTAICALLGFGAGCYKYNPTGINVNKPSALNSSSLRCSDSMNLQPAPGSYVSWRVEKYSGPKGSSPTIPVEGQISIDGLWVIPSGDIVNSRADLAFDVDSTFSGDTLRDDRIKEHILGKSMNLPVRFVVNEIRSNENSVPENDTRTFTVSGQLEIARIMSSKISFDVIMWDRDGSKTLSPVKPLVLSLRDKADKASIALDSQLQDILELVPGVNLLDDVTIDFSIPFADPCST